MWESEGRGVKKIFKKATTLAKKVARSDLERMAVSQGLAYAPKLLELGSKNIKNKKLKSLLQSEMTKSLLNKGTNALYDRL